MCDCAPVHNRYAQSGFSKTIGHILEIRENDVDMLASLVNDLQSHAQLSKKIVEFVPSFAWKCGIF